MQMGRRLHPLVFLMSTVLALGFTTTLASGATFRFPLWKDVPGRTFAVLKHGVTRGTEWAAFASRGGSSARSRTRPCITVARFTRGGRYANVGSCGPLAPEKGLQYPPVSPLLGESGASFFAISLSREVEHLQIELGSGRIIKRNPRTLSRSQARKAHLPEFRYIVVALAEDACIGQLTGFSSAGSIILDSETHEC